MKLYSSPSLFNVKVILWWNDVWSQALSFTGAERVEDESWHSEYEEHNPTDYRHWKPHVIIVLSVWNSVYIRKSQQEWSYNSINFQNTLHYVHLSILFVVLIIVFNPFLVSIEK